MSKIRLSEIERRFSKGYKFIIKSEYQNSNDRFMFDFNQEYKFVFVSYNPDAIVFYNDRNNSTFGISVINEIDLIQSVASSHDESSYFMTVNYINGCTKCEIVIAVYEVK